jgi:periplasmic copper chaperone A
MLTENTMRTLSRLALTALLIGFVAPAFAQGTGNTSITVEQPWSRATPKGAKTGAAYMTIDNKSDTADRLTGASSDVADKLQIHEMKVENGVMKMREVTDGLPIPAGGSVELKPGSYHVMMIGLKKPLTAGEKFPLTLTFEKAGNISVTVPVQARLFRRRTMRHLRRVVAGPWRDGCDRRPIHAC